MASFEFAMEPQPTTPVKTRFRTVATAIPVPDSLPILARLDKVESRSMHGQMPIVWDRAKDFQVFDRWGNCWIDFTSTIFVANAGHARDEILEAIRGTLDKELLHTYSYATEVRADFLDALIAKTPANFEKAYLVSAGTEATETMLKLVRLHAQANGKRRPGVISFDGSYHGRTVGAAQVSGNADQRAWMAFDDPNIFRLPFPYPWDAQGNTVNTSPEQMFDDHLTALSDAGIDLAQDIGGILFESYLGWSAAFFPEKYVQLWRDAADKHGFLITFDEIQSGFGRTGKLFAYERYGVVPDMIACGKGISSSLPLAAVLGRADIMDLPDVGSMSSTHSANPACCAAGLANLKAICDGGLVEESARKGRLLHDRLNALRDRHPARIRQIAGDGMVAALIFYDPNTGKPETHLPSIICERALRQGLLLVHTGRESIKIGPPLTIPDDALAEGLDVLEEIIEDVFKEDAQ